MIQAADGARAKAGVAIRGSAVTAVGDSTTVVGAIRTTVGVACSRPSSETAGSRAAAASAVSQTLLRPAGARPAKRAIIKAVKATSGACQTALIR
jgi:hypothetical protein